MPAKIKFRKKEYEVQPGLTIRTAIKELGMQPKSVIPTKKGELVSVDAIIQDGDVIRLVPVISGG